MRIYWHNCAIRIEPESEEDSNFLIEGMKMLQLIKIGREVKTRPTGKESNEKNVVVVEKVTQ